jgi:hypothetical protein
MTNITRTDALGIETALTAPEVAQIQADLKLPADTSKSIKSATWRMPARRASLTDAVVGLKRTAWKFGTAATAANAEEKAVTSHAILAEDWLPLNAIYQDNTPTVGNATGTRVWGTGATRINEELQAYVDSFGASTLHPNCHILDTDGMRLQANVRTGTFERIAIGAAKTSLGGIKINAWNVASPQASTIAQADLTSGQLALIEPGTLACGPEFGEIYTVSAKVAATNLTLQRLNGVGSGATATDTVTQLQGIVNDPPLFFHKFAAFRPSSNITYGQSASTSIPTTAWPIPSWVQPGYFILCAGGAHNPGVTGYCRIGAIAGDRMSFTPDSATTFALTVGNGGYLMFVPELWMAQMWLKAFAGPNAGKRHWAHRITATLPTMAAISSQVIGVPYTKTQWESWLSTYTDQLLGFWFAIWLMNIDPSLGQFLRDVWREIDCPEVFVSPWHGSSRITHAMHGDKDSGGNTITPSGRVRCVGSDGKTPAVPGSAWETSLKSENGNMFSADNVHYLRKAVTDGQPHTWGLTYDGDTVVFYVDDQPACWTRWKYEPAESPQRLGINAACGALGHYSHHHFLPSSNAMANAMFVKVHSVEIWQDDEAA